MRYRSLNPFQRIVVVVEDDAAAEAPFAGGLDQFAFVAAGREAAALAVPGDEDEEIGARPRPLAPVPTAIMVGIHIACVGLPIALWARRTAGQPLT